MNSPRNLAARAGRWSSQHRFKAISLWLVFVVLAVFAGNSIGTETLSDEEYGVGESQQADKAVADAFPDRSTETVLVQSGSATADQPAFRQAVDDTVRELKATDNVVKVESPYAAEGQISADGHSALVTFKVPEPSDSSDTEVTDLVEAPLATVDRLDEAHPEFRIEQFGEASADKALSESFEEDFQRAETSALPITLVILLLAFGAIVAALVPLILAATAVAAAIGLMGPLSQIWPVDESATSVILLVGLAVGVDYSMFYLRREREERARGQEAEAALEAAAATSGRAVLVSGITVAIAMAGMYLAGAATFTSFATGTILVVAIAVIGSLTVLPAVLSKLADRVNKGRIPFLTRPEERAGRESRAWSAVLDPVLRHPAISASLAVGVLLVLALPVLNLKMAVPGIDSLPQDLAVIQTYDRIQEAFPGDQIPAEVVVERGDASEQQVADAVRELRADVTASPELFKQPVTTEVSPDGSVTVIDVPIAGDGNNDASYDALHTLRDEIIPATVGNIDGAEANVTGMTAGSEDFNQLMQDRVPIVFAFVLGLAFLLLLVTFRSIVIPLKAIVLNLLSVGAAYGVVTWIFQEGHLESLLGFESTGAVTSWLPLFLFVLLFGLSMDYHVFILSRIREAYDNGMPTGEAVSQGIKSTASVITAAAAVMIAVFAIFATLSSVEFKQFGVGLAVAVLIDATIIRGVLLPAAMKLLGDWNWYLPRSLGWLPRFSRDSKAEPEPAEA
ncbi:MAG TPA: MMPL family transporter [Solirubrobacterales bacterium]|jgi:RND superfamily putative drug exporter|nr:MMPL family transporter [Solirubrobacterales bacterium]